MTEHIDIFDASLRPLGEMERVKAHKKAQWHQTFHCWVIDTTRKHILFQVRSAHTKTHPTKLDISAAGHILAGETIDEGIREVQEELGLELQMSDLIFAGKRVEVSDGLTGVKNREYQSVFFYATNQTLVDFKPDPLEVSGLAAIPLQEAIDLFSKSIDQVDVDILNVADDGRTSLGRRTLKVDDFIPRIQNYYLTASIMGQRLSEGRLPLAIS